MSNVLNSIKADLLSRRLLPLVVLVVVALVGAVAYTVLSGGASAVQPVAVTPIKVAPQVAVSAAPADTNAALSETPAGARYQRQGGAHNPFIPLPAKKLVAEKSLTKASKTPAASAAPKTSTPTVPSTPAKPTPSKPKPSPVYQVAVLFGPAATTPGQNPTLTPYENLKRLSPLPSASNPLVVFKGVSASGKGAIFVLVREAILKGQAACLPSADQCEAIDLAPGQTEELSYLEENGQTVNYEIQLVSISKHETTPTAAARSRQRESSAGRELLRHHTLPVLAELRYSPDKGVVVYRARHHRH